MLNKILITAEIIVIMIAVAIVVDMSWSYV
jgi:hypothetical protein